MKPIFPKLVVFDLDFTLWDCGGTWCDCLAPPFRWLQDTLIDSRNRPIRLYPDVMSILDCCDRSGTAMAIASRTEQPSWAIDLLELLEIRDRFAHEEIYPSSKKQHFGALRSKSSVPYHQMMFFDDERRNIDEVSQMGVSSIYVENGISESLFLTHFNKFNLH